MSNDEWIVREMSSMQGKYIKEGKSVWVGGRVEVGQFWKSFKAY